MGTDTYCLDRLQTGRVASGVQLLAQRLYRRLITPRGSLRGDEMDADYGFVLSSLLGHSMSRADQNRLRDRIVSELSKDPEVHSVSIEMFSITEGPDVRLTVQIYVESVHGDATLAIESTPSGTALTGVS